jgi:hypothetical protein
LPFWEEFDFLVLSQNQLREEKSDKDLQKA